MTDLFFTVLGMSVAAALTACAVLAVNLCLRWTGAPKRLLCLLWLAVLFRAVCPAAVPSPVSLFNLGIFQNTVEKYSEEALAGSYAGEAAYAVEGSGEYEEAVAAGLPTFTPEIDGKAMDFSAAAYVRDESGAMAEPPTVKEKWGAALTAVWLSGIGILILYGGGSYLLLRRRLRFATKWEKNVFETDEIKSSFVTGIFRPKIYLTAGLTEEQRACILRHERAHIRRGDPVLKLLFFFGCCLQWFNPFVWLSYRCFCEDMELACDEAVLRDMGEEAKETYSRTLLDCSARRRFAWGTPLAFGENATESRIKSALKWKRPRIWATAAAMVLCAFAAVCLLTDSREAPEEIGEYRGGLYIVNGTLENGTASVKFGDDLKYADGWIQGMILITDTTEYTYREDDTFTQETMEAMAKKYPVTWSCGDTGRAMISRRSSLNAGEEIPLTYGVGIDEYLTRGEGNTEIRISIAGFEEPLVLLLPSEETLAGQLLPMEKVIAKEFSLEADAVAVFSLYPIDEEQTITGFLAKRDGATDIGCALLQKENGKYRMETYYRCKNGALEQDRIVVGSVSAGGALYDVILSNNETLAAVKQYVNGSYSGKTEVNGNPSMTVLKSVAEDGFEISYEFYNAEGEQIDLYESAGLPEGTYAPYTILYQAPLFSITPDAFLETVRNVEFTVAPDRFEVSNPDAAFDSSFGNILYENPQYLSADVGEIIEGTDESGAVPPDISAYTARACWVVQASDGTDTGYRIYRMDDETWIGYWSHSAGDDGFSYCERLLGLEPAEETKLNLPAVSADMSIGAEVWLDYADDHKVVFHGGFGLYIYDLDQQAVTFAADFSRIADDKYYYGVSVSADGGTVLLEFFDGQNAPDSAFYIDTETGTYACRPYQKLPERFDHFAEPKEGNYGFISETVVFPDGYAGLQCADGTLGTLTYVRGDESCLLLEGYMAESMAATTSNEQGS